jgi:hypothetical protein
VKFRFLLYAVVLAAVFFITRATAAPQLPVEPVTVDWPSPGPVETWETVRLRHENERLRKRVRSLERYLHRRWQPTVDYAYRLASAVFGVPYWQLHSVGGCESHHYPFARNGRFLGVMQLGWRPFGFSPFDPVANVLSAAQTVRRDGSWRQWECKP